MTTPPSPKGKKQIKVGALTYAQRIKYMLEGVHSCKELAELSGLHYVTVLQYARALYEAKAAHITAWEKDDRGRDNVRIYALGKGKDAVRTSMTHAQRQKRYRDKQKHLEMINRTAR